MLNYSANSKTGYFLQRSLRFRASASAYLSRTTSTATNANKWTWSGWVKRGTLGSSSIQVLMNGYVDDNNLGNIGFNGDSLYMARLVGGSVLTLRVTNAVFRDPSSWYHIVFVFDNANTTVADRVQIYVNNVLQTYSTSNDPSTTGMYINANSTAQRIGRSGSTTSQFYFDGYIAEQNFIDGQALTPSSFGSTNSTTGVWQPARYGGTYGTNGFYLPFTDNSALTTSSNVGLGKDFSGNGNYWTTNNISITAGVTYDSMTDVPTLTSATAANFAVLNPLYSISLAGGSISNGNLDITCVSNGATSAGHASVRTTTGKYYFEVTATSNGGYGQAGLGLQIAAGSTYIKYAGTSGDTGYTSYGVYGIAYDVDAGKMWIKDTSGTWTSGDPITGTSPLYTFTANSETYPIAVSSRSTGFANSGLSSHNFGQRPFTYTPPTGFIALNTYNLPDSTIKQGNKVMDATLYTGTAAVQTIANSQGFYPDFVWGKERSAANNNIWVDSNRGATNFLVSNTNNAESTNSAVVSAIGASGFTLGTDGTINGSAQTNVAWQWNAGSGSAASNTNGSLTSTVSVNASAGFSIAKFTTQASGTGTFGHGLGIAPSFYMVTSRSAVSGRNIYHVSTGATQYTQMNTTAAAVSDSTLWNNTAPTSSVITIGTAFAGGSTAICYAWSEIAGYSKFGSYTGNSSTDGPFIYCGFRPKFILFKGSSFANNWYIEDSTTNAYNVAGAGLIPNATTAETATSTTENAVDFLSNGFKLRNNAASVAFNNSSGQTFVYAAFAENPFKNSLAR